MAEKLTEAQLWALEGISKGKGASPSVLGQHMMDRPGASNPMGRTRYKAQGYGRMGGTMMSRLEKMGLVRTLIPRHSFSAQATITDAGRAALQARGDDHGE